MMEIKHLKNLVERIRYHNPKTTSSRRPAGGVVLPEKPMEWIKIDQLKEWDKNPRKITPEAFENLKEELRSLGQYKPLLVTLANVVIGGNQRLRAMRELGWEEIKIERIAFKQEGNKVKALVDNKEQEA